MKRNIFGINQARAPLSIAVGGGYHLFYGNLKNPSDSDDCEVVAVGRTTPRTGGDVKRATIVFAKELLPSLAHAVVTLYSNVGKNLPTKDSVPTLEAFMEGKDKSLKWEYDPAERCYALDLTSKSDMNSPDERIEIDDRHYVACGNVITPRFEFQALSFYRVSPSMKFGINIPIRFAGNIQLALEYLVRYLYPTTSPHSL